MLRSYLRLVLFTAGLLFGVQIPGFISDYGKRVEAHLLEAQQSVRGYNATAQQFFKGDVQALIQHYRNSEDPVFRSDADTINTLLTRTQVLEREWLAMQGPWYARAIHVAVAADADIRSETWNGYTWQVLLAPDVIAWGIVSALLLAFLIESFFLMINWVVNGGRRKHRPERDWR
ncbi:MULTISPECIES: DUF2937 family protein [Pseudomonas]|uniref:DUF2937 family protein n=1 Tax=Pseudomonas phytophila TaxID=2867264 RepID=A0ABY6FJ31_9PSED|nr:MULTISPECIES: DUF2937 family protein [Pseudomonas]MCD5970183.1 DUF2937 family protein [Pseudomonas quasicaspiana]MCD5976186.1 DUF2937 family protein [Pseudomonas quasicaspiana]MCD5988014.1 DUF2937 family protein [Pseudomonas quasicaspiana]MDU8359666.1 DUF2937 family protein [Pseudomonas syringae group sp. J309-1]PHN27884.1 hypothetical protein AO242_07900 [Pseudomonas sp. ICMP 561]